MVRSPYFSILLLLPLLRFAAIASITCTITIQHKYLPTYVNTSFPPSVPIYVSTYIPSYLPIDIVHRYLATYLATYINTYIHMPLPPSLSTCIRSEVVLKNSRASPYKSLMPTPSTSIIVITFPSSCGSRMFHMNSVW